MRVTKSTIEQIDGRLVIELVDDFGDHLIKRGWLRIEADGEIDFCPHRDAATGAGLGHVWLTPDDGEAYRVFQEKVLASWNIPRSILDESAKKEAIFGTKKELQQIFRECQ